MKTTEFLERRSDMLKRLRHIAVLFALLLSTLGALAENAKEVPSLHGATKIDDPNIDALVVSVLNIYLLFREGVVTGRWADREIAEVNFYYASGPNFIVDQRLSPNALTAFDAYAINELRDLPTNSDTCYVQSVVLATNSQRLLLAVHHEDFDDPEDVFRCLIAGLWKFQQRDLSQLDILDWRGSFYKLTGAGPDQSIGLGKQGLKAALRTALEDAALVAGLLITTEAMVADKPAKEGAGAGGGMPDMGGMGGMM